MEEKAKHYGIVRVFDEPVNAAGKAFVVQYELRLHDGLECGGAYIKLVALDTEPDVLSSDTPYIIMFGPDKCGSTNKASMDHMFDSVWFLVVIYRFISF